MLCRLPTDRLLLVQVPPYVAKQWREAIAASAGGLVDEHSAEAATLGHLTLDEVSRHKPFARDPSKSTDATLSCLVATSGRHMHESHLCRVVLVCLLAGLPHNTEGKR